MRPLAILGVVLVVLGIGALVFQYVPITQTRTVVDAGPLQVKTTEQRNIPIPAIAGIMAVVAGVGLALASRRG
jgi:hypothetical protein